MPFILVRSVRRQTKSVRRADAKGSQLVYFDIFGSATATWKNVTTVRSRATPLVNTQSSEDELSRKPLAKDDPQSSSEVPAGSKVVLGTLQALYRHLLIQGPFRDHSGSLRDHSGAHSGTIQGFD